MITTDHLVRRIRCAFYPHVRTYGPQILVRVLPVDGAHVRILHVALYASFGMTPVCCMLCSFATGL